MEGKCVVVVGFFFSHCIFVSSHFPPIMLLGSSYCFNKIIWGWDDTVAEFGGA